MLLMAELDRLVEDAVDWMDETIAPAILNLGQRMKARMSPMSDIV